MSTEEKVLKSLAEKIKKGKPHLKDSSIQQYIRTIKKLNKLINGENSTIKNLDFIEDSERPHQNLRKNALRSWGERGETFVNPI